MVKNILKSARALFDNSRYSFFKLVIKDSHFGHLRQPLSVFSSGCFVVAKVTGKKIRSWAILGKIGKLDAGTGLIS